MSRFTEIPKRLQGNFRWYHILYMIIFSVYGVLANLYTGPRQQLLSVIYLILCAGSAILLVPMFRRSLFRMNDPLYEHRLTGKPWTLCMMRLYTYILVPIFFVAFLQLFSAVGSQFLQFDQSNVQQNPTLNNYITTFFAGFEEIWRWSMIGTVLVVFRFVLRSAWDIPAIRAVVFVLAILLSSLGFGSGHILEFTSDRQGALILFSGLGLLLALMAIITGRILLCISVHIAYDLWVTVLSAVHGHDELLSIILYLALLLPPVMTVLWHKPLYRTLRPLRNDVELMVPITDFNKVFDSESNLVRKVFNRRRTLYVDHVGSTSLPHMTGDNSVDILVSVRKVKLYRRERRALERLGYVVMGRAGVKRRILAIKPGNPSIHLHIAEVMGTFSHASFQLQQFFNRHPEEREHWGQLKAQIVAEGHVRLDTYIPAKQEELRTIIHRSYDTSSF